jgi:hypothetical protein
MRFTPTDLTLAGTIRPEASGRRAPVYCKVGDIDEIRDALSKHSREARFSSRALP